MFHYIIFRHICYCTLLIHLTIILLHSYPITISALTSLASILLSDSPPYAVMPQMFMYVHIYTIFLYVVCNVHMKRCEFSFSLLHYIFLTSLTLSWWWEVRSDVRVADSDTELSGNYHFQWYMASKIKVDIFIWTTDRIVHTIFIYYTPSMVRLLSHATPKSSA